MLPGIYFKQNNSKNSIVGINDFPNRMYIVAFIWNYYGKKYDMDFIAGFIATSQNKKTLALRPEIGWIVRHRETYNDLMKRIEANREKTEKYIFDD
ncbi:MAG: DUF4419 domain-containing protein [Lentisphaerae bacterium]|nr:DUF4419 domain-containing protein [Lentisphaerota bacterium]MCP4103005.1 DUF4419 domain-containing protein [Lentisphaerota bacterium]